MTVFFAAFAAPSAPLLAAPPAAERIFPIEPAEGAAVGTRPIFRIGCAEDPEASPLRLRITLDPVADEGRRQVLDSQSGWLTGEDGSRHFRPRRPLAEGVYRWRPWFWDGLDWVVSGRAFLLRVDATPPGPVSGLTVNFDAEAGTVTLVWEPVSLDVDGRPEFVTIYHVYRSDRRPSGMRGRVHEVGTTVEPRFTDRDPPDEASRLVFYRVTAEDHAGNEAGQPP